MGCGQTLDQIKAQTAGQNIVNKGEVGIHIRHSLDGILRILGRSYGVAEHFEGGFHHIIHLSIVVNQKYLAHGF